MVRPFQQVMVPLRSEATDAPTGSALETSQAFEGKDPLLESPALVTLTEGKTKILATDSHSHTYLSDCCVAVANFKVMTPQQAANTKPEPHRKVLLMNNHPEECEHILSQFLEQTETDVKRWYPTPETIDDSTTMKKLEVPIYDEIKDLRGKELLNQTKTDGQRKEFFPSSTGLNHHSIWTKKTEESTYQ